MVFLPALELPILLLLLAVGYLFFRKAFDSLFRAIIDSMHVRVFWGRIDLLAPIRGAFKSIITTVEAYIAGFFEGVYRHPMHFLRTLAYLLDFNAFTFHLITRYALDAFRALRSVVIPHLIRPIWHLAHRAYGFAVSLVHVVRAELVHDYAAARKQINALSHQLAVAVDVPLHGLGEGVRELDRLMGRTWKALRRLRRELTVAGIAGLVLAVLARYGLGSLRCRNPKKLARSLCGMPFHWFDDLLALVADFVILTEICKVLPWLEEGFTLVAAPLISTLTEAEKALCGDDPASIPKLTVPPLSLPPNPSLTLYLP